MSRLQKKKPTSEKKKRKVEDSQAVDSTAVSSAGSGKSAAAVGPKKAAVEKKAADVQVREPNIFQKAIDFVREVKVELKKVTWPTRKQTTGTTIVVIIFVFIVAAFLGLFDYSLSKLVQVVLT